MTKLMLFFILHLQKSHEFGKIILLNPMGDFFMKENDSLSSLETLAKNMLNLIIDTNNPLKPYRLIGYFADNEDSGYILIDRDEKKHYVPIYCQFYISDLNNIVEIGTLNTFNDLTNKNENKFIVKNKNGDFFWLRGCKKESEINSATGNDIPLSDSLIFEDFRTYSI